jgi:hypothetical protein
VHWKHLNEKNERGGGEVVLDRTRSQTTKVKDTQNRLNHTSSTSQGTTTEEPPSAPPLLLLLLLLSSDDDDNDGCNGACARGSTFDRKGSGGSGGRIEAAAPELLELDVAPPPDCFQVATNFEASQLLLSSLLPELWDIIDIMRDLMINLDVGLACPFPPLSRPNYLSPSISRSVPCGCIWCRR